MFKRLGRKQIHNIHSIRNNSITDRNQIITDDEKFMSDRVKKERKLNLNSISPKELIEDQPLNHSFPFNYNHNSKNYCNNFQNSKSNKALYHKQGFNNTVVKTSHLNLISQVRSDEHNKAKIEEFQNCNSIQKYQKYLNYLYEFLFIEFGIISIYVLTKYAKINSVYALSTMVFIIVSLFKSFGVLFLCGAFSSVMNPDTLNNPGFLLFCGLCSFILFSSTRTLLLNIGGRPGVYSFISNLITFILVYLISLGKTYEYDPMNFIIDMSYFGSMNAYVYIFGPLCSAFSAILVYLIAEQMDAIIKLTHRLIAYSVVCTFGCMFWQTFNYEYRIMPDNSIMTYGQLFINYWHLGCLSALSIKSRYRKSGRNILFHYALAGYFSGWVGLSFMGVLLFGGKHGISVFIANVVYIFTLNWIFPENVLIKENNQNVANILFDYKIKNNKMTENASYAVYEKIMEKDNNNRNALKIDCSSNLKNFKANTYSEYQTKWQG